MSQTPARMTRSRANTPAVAVQPKLLPSLQTKSSTSYGSRGKATLQSQTAAAVSATQFEDAFSTARAQAQEFVIPKRRDRRTMPPAEEFLATNEDDLDSSISLANGTRSFDDDEISRPDTSIDAGAMYDRPLSGSISAFSRPVPRSTTLRTASPQLVSSTQSNTYAQGERISSRLAREVMPPPASRRLTSQQIISSSAKSSPGVRPPVAKVVEEEPSSVRVFASTLTRYFPELIRDANTSLSKWLLRWLLALFLLGLLVTGLFILLALLYSAIPLPRALQESQETFVTGMKYALGFSPRDSLLEQIGQLSSGLQSVEEMRNLYEESRKTLILQDHALDELRAHLPDVVLVEKVDGRVTLTKEFWNALEQRLVRDQKAPLWSALLRTHETQLRTMISEESEKTYVSKEEYLLVVDKAVHERFGNVLAKVDQRASQIAATVSRETVEEYMKKNAGSFTEEDRQALAQFTRIQAAYDAINTVNFFDPGLGAIVVPRLTSSTQKPPPRTWRQYLWSYQELILISQYPPSEALNPTDSASDCWCASPSIDRKGKAQITIRTPLKFYPDTLVIEHIPLSGTLDISTAPKNFEVWAELPSAADVKGMRRKIAYFLGNDRSAECGPAPTDRSLCMYRGEYDIRAGAAPQQHVQAFKLWYHPIERLDLQTDLITVRITENWGADWTCLYRLRMTGSRTDVGPGAEEGWDYYGEPKDEMEVPPEFWERSGENSGSAGSRPRVVQTVWHE